MEGVSHIIIKPQARHQDRMSFQKVSLLSVTKEHEKALRWEGRLKNMCYVIYGRTRMFLSHVVGNTWKSAAQRIIYMTDDQQKWLENNHRSNVQASGDRCRSVPRAQSLLCCCLLRRQRRQERAASREDINGPPGHHPHVTAGSRDVGAVVTGESQRTWSCPYRCRPRGSAGVGVRAD